jgi:hypothetical protein
VTLLLYNHYDVQPPEPLEEWVTPPVEPSLREGRLFARGARGTLLLQLYLLLIEGDVLLEALDFLGQLA